MPLHLGCPCLAQCPAKRNVPSRKYVVQSRSCQLQRKRPRIRNNNLGSGNQRPLDLAQLVPDEAANLTHAKGNFS